MSAHYTVTGGAGFIGSSLVAHLLEQGAEVTVFDNLVNGSRDNLRDATGGDVRLVEGDVRDSAALQSVRH